MSVKELLHLEIDKISDSMLPDILNFILFLENKSEKTELYIHKRNGIVQTKYSYV